MIYIGVQIGRIKSGKFKVYLFGQHSNHFIDWYGCNYRLMSVKGQPTKGFDKASEAEAWARKKFNDDEAEAYDYAYENGEGSFLSDDSKKELTNVYLAKDSHKKRK